MQLSALTDAELARHAEISLDDLTSTEMERELIKRFHALIEESAGAMSVINALEDHGIDVDDAKALSDAVDYVNDCEPKVYRPLIEVLTEFDIDDAKVLREALQRDKDIPDVLDDLTEPLARLAAIVNPSPVPTPN